MQTQFILKTIDYYFKTCFRCIRILGISEIKDTYCRVNDKVAVEKVRFKKRITIEYNSLCIFNINNIYTISKYCLFFE